MKKHDQIDEMLTRAGEREPGVGVPHAVIARAQTALLGDLRPARRLSAPWVFAVSFVGVFAAVAVLAAAILGFFGVQVLDAVERGTIFPALAAAAGFAAVGLSREMRPAAGRHLGTAVLAASLIGFPLIFFANFHDFNLGSFVREGWPCLRAGTIVAIPAGLIAAFLLRRGFVLSWKMAGLAAGTFAGLTGLAMLELHCLNLKVMHIVVWHLAVVATSAIIGLVAGSIADARRRRN